MSMPNTDTEVSYELTAFYTSSSRWTLDFDLKDVYEWYVKWDTLYVKHHENDAVFVKYHPNYSAFADEGLKHPESLWIEDEEVRV
jgi:hypothetical protein